MPKGHPDGPRCHVIAKTSKRQCRKPAVKGARVCRIHGGGSPVIQRRARVVYELEHWGVDDQHVDPGEQLLRLLAQSARRASFYGSLLERAHRGELDDHSLTGSGVGALIGKKFFTNDVGAVSEAGDYIRGLAELEFKEREFCARLSKMAIEAGLEARRVALAEREADAVVKAIESALTELGLAERVAEVLPAVAVRLDQMGAA